MILYVQKIGDLHPAFIPIGFPKNKRPSNQNLISWVIEKSPNVVEKSNPLTSLGCLGLLVGAVTSLVSKHTSNAAIIGIGSIVSILVGFAGGANLNPKSVLVNDKEKKDKGPELSPDSKPKKNTDSAKPESKIKSDIKQTKEELVELFKDSSLDLEDRKRIAVELVKIGDKDSISILLETLKNKNKALNKIREAVGYALAFIKKDNKEFELVKSELLKLVQEKDDYRVLANIAFALGEIGDKDTATILEQIKTRSKTFRYALDMSLGRLRKNT